jgi:hypothetical protein
MTTINLVDNLVPTLPILEDFKFLSKTRSFGQRISHQERITKSKKYASCDNHFINTFLHAYNSHLPLSLSCDNILLAIGQVISTFVNKNSELLRSLFVDHEGQKELVVILDELDFDKFMDLLNEEVSKNVKNELNTLMVPNFSTTTQISQTVGNMTALTTFKEYFKYTMICMCGIPSVRLEGCKSDWTNLFDKYLRIKAIFFEIKELEQWFNKFDVVMNLFMNMINNPNEKRDEIIDLWSRVITVIPYGSGSDTYLGGWIHLFCPFNSGGKMLDINKMYDVTPFQKDEFYKYHFYEKQDKMMETHINNSWNTIPSSVLTFDAKLVVLSDEYQVSVSSGFLGSCYVNNYVSPIVGWCVNEKDMTQ